MDIKLKDILKYIKTYQKISLNNYNNGECFSPLYHDLFRYSEYYVTEFYADENELVIKIREMI